MRLIGEDLEAQPSPVGHLRVIGEIWQEGGEYLQRMPGGVWKVPFVLTFIERDGFTELLRFGICETGLLWPDRMPCLSCAGATAGEIHEAREMVFDDERQQIKRLLRRDDIELAAWRRGEECR